MFSTESLRTKKFPADPVSDPAPPALAPRAGLRSGEAMTSNQPVAFLGRIAVRRGPIAHLDDVSADARLGLRQAPTPISGGMRKALAKERGQQDALRWRPRRNWFDHDQQRAFGMIMVGCPRCQHAMFYDQIEDAALLRCDRCKGAIWPG